MITAIYGHFIDCGSAAVGTNTAFAHMSYICKCLSIRVYMHTYSITCVYRCAYTSKWFVAYITYTYV